MITSENISWHEVSRWRNEGAKRFGQQMSLPIIQLADEVRRYAVETTRLLDVGAGVEKHWREHVSPDQYFSMDIDPSGEFDFRTFDDIPNGVEFDLILMNQLIEHLTIAEALEIVSRASRHLAIGGHLIATVPNPAHPVRHWGDATHATAWPILDLYGLFRSSGYDVVQLARYGKRQIPRNWIRRFIVKVVSHEFRIDWADSLFLAARQDRESHPSEASLSEDQS